MLTTEEHEEHEEPTMYDHTVDRDYVKTELEYRLGRIQADLAGRRRKRLLTRRATGGDGEIGWTRTR
ncbi:MAG: hypothetical protein H6529_12205 [Nocardioides sp.]|nr:hypothetical protein [Nocardioides sp.]